MSFEKPGELGGWSRPGTNPLGGGGAGTITDVTGSDGVTVTSPTAATRLATNDLVTGTTVAQLDVDATGDADIVAGGAVHITGDEAVTITASTGPIDIETSSAEEINLISAGRINVHATALAEITGSGVRIVSNPASQLVLGSGANTLLDVGGTLLVTIGGNSSFTADPGSNGGFIVQADGTGGITFVGDQDEVHTLGRHFSAFANNDLTLGCNDDMTFEPGTLGFFGQSGYDGTTNAITPTGGSVIDAEARAAIDALNAVMVALGLMD
jgi:hypothetical protein